MNYVSLERPDVRSRALAGPVGFFAKTAGPLILDEIQYAPEPKIYYWQPSGGKEVDLIVERDGKLYALEVKATATPRARHGSNINEPRALLPGIRAVPWHLNAYPG